MSYQIPCDDSCVPNVDDMALMRDTNVSGGLDLIFTKNRLTFLLILSCGETRQGGVMLTWIPFRNPLPSALTHVTRQVCVHRVRPSTKT